MPPNVPVEQYWSVTAYDRQTHALDPQYGAPEPLLADSRDAEERRWLDRRLFRPEAPERARSRTGCRRIQKRGFELMFRLYAPTKAFFDKVWVLPDVERIAAQ